MKIRLAKFIADNGNASRRGAEQLIESGAVTVNGEKITTPVFFVDKSEDVRINGKKISNRQSEIIVYAFHKPINTITSTFDPAGRTTIYDVLKDGEHLKYVGRLDFKTTGLLLMTNDGELARKLTLPSSKIQRTYVATIHPMPFAQIKNTNLMRRFLSPIFSDGSIFDALRTGITINGIRYAPMELEIISRYPLMIQLTISEGKKNEIRIALNHIGFMVKKLHRIKFGPIELGELKPGKMRKLSPDEIHKLTHKLM